MAGLNRFQIKTLQNLVARPALAGACLKAGGSAWQPLSRTLAQPGVSPTVVATTLETLGRALPGLQHPDRLAAQHFLVALGDGNAVTPGLAARFAELPARVHAEPLSPFFDPSVATLLREVPDSTIDKRILNDMGMVIKHTIVLYDHLLRWLNRGAPVAERALCCMADKIPGPILDSLYHSWLMEKNPQAAQRVAAELIEHLPRTTKLERRIYQQFKGTRTRCDRALVFGYMHYHRDELETLRARYSADDGAGMQERCGCLQDLMGELSVFEAALLGLRRILPQEPLVSAPPRGSTERMTADIGSVPYHVFVGMSEPDTMSWTSRIATIQAVLAHYPESVAVVSVDGDLLPQLDDILHERLTAAEYARLKYAYRYGQRGSADQDVSWFRDRMAFMETKEGQLKFIVTHGAFARLAPLMMAVARSHRAQFATSQFESLEGGQVIVGRDQRGEPLALVGIDYLFEREQALREMLPDFSFFDEESMRQILTALASMTGVRTVLVGDAAVGQSFRHIDLYVSLRSDGTVMMADYEAGWQKFTRMSRAETEAFIAEHDRRAARNSRGLPGSLEDDPVRKSLEALLDPESPVRAAMERYSHCLQVQIRREADLLKKAGLAVEFVPAFFVISYGGGMSALNGIAHRVGDRVVRLVPGYGDPFDQAILAAYHQGERPNLAEDVRLVSGLELAASGMAGSIRCLTSVITAPRPPAPIESGGVWPAAMVKDYVQRARALVLTDWLSERSGHLFERDLWDAHADLIDRATRDLLPRAFDNLMTTMAEVGHEANVAHLRPLRLRILQLAVMQHRLVMAVLPVTAESDFMRRELYWHYLLDHACHILAGRYPNYHDNAAVLFSLLAVFQIHNSMVTDRSQAIPMPLYAL